MDRSVLEPEKLQQRLGKYVGAARGGVDREEFLKTCTAEAIELVVKIAGDAAVPGPVAERAVIEAGADLFWRQLARNGVVTLEGDGALEAVRIGNDPTRSARAVLDPYLPAAIA